MAEKKQTDKYDVLRLDHQLCFPLYACAKEVVRRYKPFLDEIDLTYTQYITMMVLWEKKQVTVKELGESLFLDSGTLTPLLKKRAFQRGRTRPARHHHGRRRGAEREGCERSVAADELHHHGSGGCGQTV